MLRLRASSERIGTRWRAHSSSRGDPCAAASLPPPAAAAVPAPAAPCHTYTRTHSHSDKHTIYTQHARSAHSASSSPSASSAPLPPSSSAPRRRPGGSSSPSARSPSHAVHRKKPPRSHPRPASTASSPGQSVWPLPLALREPLPPSGHVPKNRPRAQFPPTEAEMEQQREEERIKRKEQRAQERLAADAAAATPAPPAPDSQPSTAATPSSSSPAPPGVLVSGPRSYLDRPAPSLWSFGLGALGGLGRDTYASSPLPQPIPAVSAETPLAVASSWSRNCMISEGGGIYEWGWRATFRYMLKVALWHRKWPRVVRFLQSLRLGIYSLCGADPLTPYRLWGWGQEPDDPPLKEGEQPPNIAVGVSCGGDFTAVLSQEGQVYTWGKNFYGQLGHSQSLRMGVLSHPTLVCHYQNQHPNESLGMNLEAMESHELPTSFPNSPIVQVSAGWAHMLILTQNGQVYACGKCDTGALGITHIYRESKRLFYPHLIPVTDAYAASEHGAGEVNLKVRAADSGEAATTQFDLAQNDPSIVDQYVGPMVAVAAGMKHSLFLNADGEVFACGSNGLNEVGNSTFHPVHGLVKVKLPLAPAPSSPAMRRALRRQLSRAEVEHAENANKLHFFNHALLSAEKIIKISAGNHHNLALSNRGHVYAWGLNQQGQCGVEVGRKWSGKWMSNVLVRKLKPPTLDALRKQKEEAEEKQAKQDDSNASRWAITPYVREKPYNLAPVNTSRLDQTAGICIAPTRIPLTEETLGIHPGRLGTVVDIVAGFHDSALITDKGYCIMFGGGLDARGCNKPYIFSLERPTPDVSPEQLQVEESVRERMRKPHRVKSMAFGLGHAIALVEPKQ